MTSPSDRPLTFVIMPYGKRYDPMLGAELDFDLIYEQGIKKAIESAGMTAIRSDLERKGGIVHRAMFERILLCEYAVADLTTCNPNVLYELGIRHATRRATTLPIHAAHQTLPFNVGPVQAMPYGLRALDAGSDGELFGPEEQRRLIAQLSERLTELRERARNDAHVIDSPLFQILTDWRPQPLAREKTDTFRERVEIDQHRREQLEEIRRLPNQEAVPQLDALADAWLENSDVETGSFLDLMDSYRHVEAWSRMIDVIARFPAYLQRQVLVREQLAFAYNRRAGAAKTAEQKRRAVRDRDRALQLLREVEAQQGPSAETCGLLGRIHKDLWRMSYKTDPIQSAAHLDEAIECYRRGSDSDLRDTYPAINLLTLLDIRGGEGDDIEKALRTPVVERAIDLRAHKADYWDHATMLELGLLSDSTDVDVRLGRALKHARASWEPTTTADNVAMIRDARASRASSHEKLDETIRLLRKKAKSLEAGRA